MPDKSLSAGSIWKTLSAIDCSSRTEDKGGLTYLPWGEAITVMMEHFPEYTVKWHGTEDKDGVTRDITYYEGGSASVACTVTIGEIKRECWLPVMDYKNKAIAYPDSRSISDSKKAAPTEDSAVQATATAATLKALCRDLHESGWTPEPSMQKDIKTAVAEMDVGKMDSLIKTLIKGGDLAKKLNDDTTTEVSDG